MPQWLEKWPTQGDFSKRQRYASTLTCPALPSPAPRVPSRLRAQPEPKPASPCLIRATALCVGFRLLLSFALSPPFLTSCTRAHPFSAEICLFIPARENGPGGIVLFGAIKFACNKTHLEMSATKHSLSFHPQALAHGLVSRVLPDRVGPSASTRILGTLYSYKYTLAYTHKYLRPLVGLGYLHRRPPY